MLAHTAWNHCTQQWRTVCSRWRHALDYVPARNFALFYAIFPSFVFLSLFYVYYTSSKALLLSLQVLHWQRKFAVTHVAVYRMWFLMFYAFLTMQKRVHVRFTSTRTDIVPHFNLSKMIYGRTHTNISPSCTWRTANGGCTVQLTWDLKTSVQ